MRNNKNRGKGREGDRGRKGKCEKGMEDNLPRISRMQQPRLVRNEINQRILIYSRREGSQDFFTSLCIAERMYQFLKKIYIGLKK